MLSLKYHTTCMPSIPLQPEVTKKQDVGEQGCNNALYDRHPFFRKKISIGPGFPVLVLRVFLYEERSRVYTSI